MTLGEQWRKIKENWLLIVLPIALLFVVFGGLGSVTSSFESADRFTESFAPSPSPGFASRGMISPEMGGFAPGVKDRLITKTASLSSEIDRGRFDDSVTQLRSVVKTADAYILNENIAKRGEDAGEYRTGSWELKVESSKYEAFTSQLKQIGEVQSFVESADDVTGVHTDLSIQLEGERERLKRYESMYAEAKEVEDKIQLSDRIFNQQNLIKQLENSLQNIQQQVSYSTVSVYLEEEKSDFAGIEFVGLGELAAGFVGSLSSLLEFIVAVLPWLVAGWLAVLLWRKVRSKKR